MSFLASSSSLSQDMLSSNNETVAATTATTMNSTSSTTMTITTSVSTETSPNARATLMQNPLPIKEENGSYSSSLPGTDGPNGSSKLNQTTLTSATSSNSVNKSSVTTLDSKTTYMIFDEPSDSLPNIMKANQLTSLVHRNIPPQEHQHFHRSALLKTILAGGVTSNFNVNNNNTNQNGETKFEMNFSNGKLGLSSPAHTASSGKSLHINNNNTSLLDNNASQSSVSTINNNAPLDLSIDAAIKEVVSKDGNELGNGKLLHSTHHHLFHSLSSIPGRLSSNSTIAPLRFPSSSTINHNNSKEHAPVSLKEEQPLSVPLSSGVTSIEHSIGNHPSPRQDNPVPSANAFQPKAVATSPPHQLPPMPTSANILPRSSISAQQIQQQLHLDSDVAKSSSPSLSLSSSSLSIGSLHKDVQHKTLESGTSSTDQAAAAAALKRQRGSNSTKLPEHGRVRRKRQTLQEMARPLKEWMETHLDNPYPSKQEKQSLSQASHMTLVQVANWFANARRRLKIAEKRTGNDLAAKLAAISQSDPQMDIDEEMEEVDGNLSEGEGELQIDLGSKSSIPQQPSEDILSRYVPTTLAGEPANENHLKRLDHHRSGNNSILQRFMNELPSTEAETVAAAALVSAHRSASDKIKIGVRPTSGTEKPQRFLQEVPLVFPASMEPSTSAKGSAVPQTLTQSATATSLAPLPKHRNPTSSLSTSIPHQRQQQKHQNGFVIEEPAASAITTSTASHYQHQRRSPGMGSVSSHDYEDCGQAASETSSTSEALDWTFNSSTQGENVMQSRSPPPKTRNEMFDDNQSLHAIEIDAALALVALSRMRQTERLQRQRVDDAMKSAPEDSGVATLSFPNNSDPTHGATIRVRQKH